MKTAKLLVGMACAVIVGILAGCPGPTVVATPEFSPPAGAYTGTQTVEITSATPGALIRYTTDDTDPSSVTGTLYAEPISISATGTLRAVAYAAGLLDSEIAAATYTIAASAQDFVLAAYEQMRDGDWDAALSSFSAAVLMDGSNGEAVVGYAVLNIASITVDDDMVTVAREHLGLEDYPTNMSVLFSPSWLTDMGPGYGFMPDITGQEDWADMNGEPGTVDPMERMMALMSFVASHNPTGPSEILQTMAGILSERLDVAIQAINAADDDMSMTLDWQMFTSDDSVVPDGWPRDSSNNPVGIVVGKAEALGMAAYLGSVRMVAELAQVYNLTLPLDAYWQHFGPDPVGGYPGDEDKPFSAGFLDTTPQAATHLADARAAFLQASTNLMTASETIRADRPGFTLSSDATWLFSNPSAWSSFDDEMRIAWRWAKEQKESLEQMRTAVFPMGWPDPDNWPVVPIDPGSEFGVNFGVFFDAPVGLATALLETNQGAYIDGPNLGELVFYELRTGVIARVTFEDIDTLGGGAPPYDFVGDEIRGLLRIQDMTLGGVIPLASIPVDDPETGIASLDFSYNDNSPADGHWTWADGDLDELYDPGEGETIYWVNTWCDVEGPIDMEQIGSYESSDPYLEYLTVPDWILDLELDTPTPAYRQALRDAMAGYVYAPSLQFLDGTSYYVPGPPLEVIWHAYTTDGDEADFDSGLSVSTGSAYWYMLESMLPW